MKKRILSILLAVMVVVSLLPTAALAAVTSLSNVTFTVEANKEAGLGGDVKITFTRSGSNYSGTLYLPGSADASRLTLSWEEGVTVASYASGEAPVPANGASKTYSVTAGGNTASFTVKTMQGSADVEGMFLTIDESLGTIADMNGDKDHETECFGAVAFDGETHDMSMKGRGNSTWSRNKKPYNITFYKSDNYEGDKKKVELIKDIKTKKWSILANAIDGSLMRNKVGNDLAVALGIGLESRFIDVWMNGEYLGNYLLTPKNDYQAPDDGYMVEIDNFTDVDQFVLTDSTKFTVKEMADGLTVNDVKASVSKAWDILRKSNSDEYLEYFDLDSWAKMYLLHEFYKDHDILAGSFFFTKETMGDDTKLVAGPIWDLDLTQGRTSQTYVSLDHNAEKTGGGWYLDSITATPTSFFQLLGKHESFMKRVYEIYNENKAAFDGVTANIEAQRLVLAGSAEMNFMRNDVELTQHNVSKDNTTYGSGTYAVTYQKTNDWADYVDNYKEYATKRLAFFSDNLTVTAPAAGSITGATTLAVGDGLSLTADCTADSYQWQSSADGENWTDIAGATAQSYSATALYTMNGLHIRCVAKNVGSTINTTRVAKVAPAASTVLAPVTLTVTLEGHEHSYQSAVTDPTCTEPGYTTHTCACGDSYVDTYTDALEHNFVGGKCTRCEERNPAYIPQCVVNKSVSLSEGKLFLTLGGQNLGEYTFTRSGSGWTIKDKDGKYLGFANNALSDNEFAWTYTGGRFQTSVTTTTGGGNTGWGFGGFGFFGFGGFGGGNRTTTYYLAYVNGNITVSTSTTGANASFAEKVENLTHTLGEVWTTDKNSEQHYRICSVCGEQEYEACVYDRPDYKCVCGRVNPAYIPTGDGIAMQYDDYYTFESAVTIDAGGNAVLETSGTNKIHAIGLGTASVTADGIRYDVTVSKAQVSIIMIGGQSNATRISNTDTPAIACKEGTAYLWETPNTTAPKALTSTGGFLSALCAEWYAQSAAAGSPKKPVLVQSDSYTSRAGLPLSTWVNNNGTLTQTGSSVVEMIKECIAYFEQNPNYEIADAGMYWLHGSADKSTGSNSYYTGFSSYWNVLKDAGLRYCGILRDRSNCTYGDLSYECPEVGEFNLINQDAGVFMATDLDEGWYDQANSSITVDTSKYLTISGNSATKNLSAFFKDGGTHFSQFGFNLLGADSAYNMYRALYGSAGYTLTLNEASGRSATRSVLASGTPVNMQASDIHDDLYFYVSPGSGAAKLEITVTEGQTDITDDVIVGTASNNFGMLSISALKQQENPVITFSICNASDEEIGKVICNLMTQTTQEPGEEEEPDEGDSLCSGDVSASLSEGKLFLTLGGHELGEYTFARSGNNWTIKDKDGKYLGFANNALSDNEFAWTYTGGRFQTSVTTTTPGGNTGWGGGFFGFFGFGGFGGGNRTTTTTYYLVCTNGGITVSTSADGANASFTRHVDSDTHSFGVWTTEDGVHSHTCTVCGEVESGECSYGADHRCTVCGAYDPDAVEINVSVSLSQRTGGGNSGFGGFGFFGFFGFGGWGGNSTTTTYTATITTRATGTTVKKTEFSTNGGASWTTGTTVTSGSQIGSFLIRVTDSNTNLHSFKYENGTVSEVK